MAANVTRSRTSHVQTAQDVFYLLKGPDPNYPVLKFGNNLSSRNRDMAQSVILYSCDLERSRSTVRSIKFCTAMRTHTHEYTCEVSLKSYCQLFRYGEQIVARRKKKERTRRLQLQATVKRFLFDLQRP